MTDLFKKLNFKGHKPVVVLNAPTEFTPEMEAMQGHTTFVTKVTEAEFFIAFVTTKAEIDNITPKIAEAAQGDAVVWFAYPKGTSKKYKSEVNRDNGAWEALGKQGYEGVRQVAIDADWSALRFRKVDNIKTLARNPKLAMSDKGKARTTKNDKK